MPRINDLVIEYRAEPARAQPTKVVARVKVFTPEGSRADTIIQIDTLGSSERKKVGSQSQTFQLDRGTALKLMKLIQDTYELG